MMLIKYNSYSFEKKNMPTMDMKVLMKTPLLRGFDSFSSEESNKNRLRISNTSVIKKDETRKIKLMNLPILKKKNSKTLKSQVELIEEENMLESSANFKMQKKLNSLEKVFKPEQNVIEIPLEGYVSKFF